MTEIKLLSWNVNGLRAAAKKGFVEQMWKLDPDIICLQEIKAKQEQLPPEVEIIPGYRSYFFSAQRPGYSGVAVYTKLEPETVGYGIGAPRFDEEGRVLVLDFPTFRLLNAYFPNGGGGPERLEYKMDFCRYMQAYCREFQKAHPERPLVLCGDFNTAHKEIDLARPKENATRSGFLPLERAWIDQFLAEGFEDTFRLFNQLPQQYTWWDMKTRARERNVGWRIDYFVAASSLKERIKGAAIWPEITGSDHCPVTLDLALE